MTNLAIIPLQDSFETTLSQELGTTGTTIYVNAIPSYSPSNTPTYAVINPKKTNAELVLISNYDAISKTLTISSRPIARTLWVTPVSQTHPVWSTIIISDNYQFWQNIKTAMNTKIDWIVQGIPFFADASARDSAIPNPTNWLIVWLTTPWKITYYIWGRIDLWTWATFINASTTEAGKVQQATVTDIWNQTEFWTTWAPLFINPSSITTEYIWSSSENTIPVLNSSWLITDFLPAWVIFIWTTASIPNWFLLCDWSAISRSTYSTLFNVIWTTYGSGDGTTTFNLPNLKGNVPVGLDASQTEFDALWETGGEKTHTLTAWEMQHNHTVILPSTQTFSQPWANAVTPDTLTTSWVSNVTATAHNNLQPYIVLNYIIKS